MCNAAMERTAFCFCYMHTRKITAQFVADRRVDQAAHNSDLSNTSLALAALGMLSPLPQSPVPAP